MQQLLVAAGVVTPTDVGPARAVLLRDDRITWVGADPAEAPGADIRITDLGSAWIAPAFVDAHVHATATGLVDRGVRLAGSHSLAEVLERLRLHAGASDDDVILGAGWDDFAWAEGRPPTAEEVAHAAPGRTVLLHRVDGHSCVVDPVTLTGLPLQRLPGVDLDQDGHPTGWLREQACVAAQEAVRSRLPQPQVRAARATTCAKAASLGIASLHEMGHPGVSGLDDTVAWASGDWPVQVLTWWADLDADVARRAHPDIRPGGDLFLDGSIGSRSAATSFPYDGDGGQGELFHDGADVDAFFVSCTRAGRGAGVHAIGDRAIEQALQALEAAEAACGAAQVRACRHRIEHVELPSRAQTARMARLGVVASVQPAFDATWGGEDGLYAARFGGDVARVSNPLRWFAEEGVALAFGSDSTVTPLDPWGGVWAATRHSCGLSLGLRAAFDAHTRGGRYVAGQDDSGVVRQGAVADLAVWSGDPLGVADPRTLTCLATLVGGRVAWGDLDHAP